MTHPAPARGSASARSRVRDLLRELVTEWYGPEARVAGEPRFESRTWSVHARPVVSTPDRRIELVVKIPTWEEAPNLPAALAAGPQPATLGEFRALGEIRAMVAGSGDPGLLAVVPVAYVPELNAVVTERLDAVPLRTLLRPGGWSTAVVALGAVGRWLRRYHEDVGGAARAPYPVERAEAEIDRMVETADAAGAPPLIRIGLLRLLVEVGALGTTEVTTAVTHGDLGPSNVLVDGAGRVAVIDPNDVLAPVVADPAKLMAAVRTAPTRLLSGIPRRPQPTAAERALLDAYRPADAGAFAVARGLACIRRWLDVERATGVRRAWLAMARRVLHGELTGLLSAFG